MPKLSVNLIAYNGEKYISSCLMSVMAQTFRDFSVLIIDNGSTDRTKAEIKKWEKMLRDNGISVNVIYNEKNIGFASGHNMGILEVQSFSQRLISLWLTKFQSEADHPHPKAGAAPLADKAQNDGFAEEKNPSVAPFKKGGNIEYICCLNQDVILAPEYLERVVEFMDEHPDCASASGKLMRMGEYANQREWESEFKRMTISSPSLAMRGTLKPPRGVELDYERLAQECKIIDSVGLRIFKSRRTVEIGQGEEDKGQYDDIKEVFGVSGTLPVYRLDALEDVKIPNSKFQSSKFVMKSHPLPEADKCPLLVKERGRYEYFDADFFSYKEDVDLAYRLRWRGWKSYTVGQAVAYHKRSASQNKSKLSDFTAAFNRKNKSKYTNYLSQRNQIWMLIKNLDRLNFFVVWYEMKKFGYELIFEWSAFKAWFDILKKMRVMREKRRWIMGNRKISSEEMERWFEGRRN